MNSKEALEILNIAWSGRKDKDGYPNFDDIHMALYTLDKNLERLEKFAHENASLHTEIESLQSENEIWKKAIENSNKAYDVLMQNSNIQFLNQNQEIFKLKKVIEILKDKIEFEDLGEMQSGNMYRGYFNDCLDEEEYEILKEYL